LKKKLYLNIDGVIMGKRNINDHEVILAGNTFGFLQFCLNRFECFWFSTHSRKGNINEVIRNFAPYANAQVLKLIKLIKTLKWDIFKVYDIDFNSDFIWLDDELSWYERKVMDDNKALNRLVHERVINVPDVRNIKNVMADTVTNGISEYCFMFGTFYPSCS
jgi:hypothetical protein